MCTASAHTANTIPSLVVEVEVVEVMEVVEGVVVVRARERRAEVEPTGPAVPAGDQAGGVKELGEQGAGNQTGTGAEDSRVVTRRTASTKLRSRMEIFLEQQERIIPHSPSNNWRRKDLKESSRHLKISYRRIILNRVELADQGRSLARDQGRGRDHSLALSLARDLVEVEEEEEGSVPALWMTAWAPVRQI